MASSDNLISMDPCWIFRNPFPDTYNFAKETETFAKALQKTFETQDFSTMTFSEDLIYPPYPNTQPISPPYSNTQPISPTSTDSFVSTEVVTSNKRKIANRKPRASKREKTTFIHADAASFRRLVQDYTGVKFGNGNGVVNGSQLVKPEPHRMSQLQMIGSLPTLDTSSFLLNPTFAPPSSVAGGVSPPSSVGVADGGRGCMNQFDFDSFCSFPTLESWKGV